MPVFNILDQRKSNDNNPNCDVVFEIWSDDWTVFNQPRNTETITEWLHRTTVYSALSIGMRFGPNVTVYLYDPNWIPSHYGLIGWTHPRIKRDPMVPHQYNADVLRSS